MHGRSYVALIHLYKMSRICKFMERLDEWLSGLGTGGERGVAADASGVSF